MTSDRRGAILLLVLILLVVLTAIVVQFMFSTRVDSRIAESHVAAVKNNAAIRGAVAKAMTIIIDQEEKGETDEMIEELLDSGEDGGGFSETLTFEDTKVRLLILDEEGKLNLNLLHEKAGSRRAMDELERLGKHMGMSGSDAEDFADSLRDWIDEDSDGDSEEEALNRMLVDVSEILRIEVINDVLYYGGFPDPGSDLVYPGLHKFVTIWGAGKVNINSAPAEVLASLGERMDLDTARDIVEYRQEQGDFKSLQDLANVEGVTPEMIADMADRTCDSGTYYTVLAFAETGSFRAAGVSIIKRDQETCAVLRSVAEDNRLWQTYADEIESIIDEEEEYESEEREEI